MLFSHSACADGNVRLMNGTSSTEGRVEVCYNGTYETVCDDFWDELEARVVCNQLNFTSPGTSEKHIVDIHKIFFTGL